VDIDAHLLASALVGHLRVSAIGPHLATLVNELGISYE
jgi:hypothetical protein